MKNKIPNEDSLFQKKGFFVALYSCIGIVMVLAVVISYNNLSSMTKAKEIKNNETAQVKLGELKPAINDEASSYLAPSDKTAARSAAATPKPEEPTKKTEPDAESKLKSTAPKAEVKPESTPKPATAPNNTKPSAQLPAEESSEQSTSADIVSPDSSEVTAQEYEERFAEALFSVYNDDSKMTWPVVGEIVMDYNVDMPIVYDETLDQWRTNDSVSIKADIGTQVKSAADGIVRQITTTRENGNQVVIDHGNGWMTTYSQLQDGILVQEGEVVKSGQAIGGVGSPSIYGKLLGNHLDFKVSQNSSTVDPKMILE